jgi:hypothetical protein
VAMERLVEVLARGAFAWPPRNLIGRKARPSRLSSTGLLRWVDATPVILFLAGADRLGS